MEPDVARQGWRALEPYHAMVYFAAEPQQEYAALGLDVQANPMAGYVPARAAALGRVLPGAVHASFFNFSRRAVDAGLVGAWQIASPEQVLAARLRGADRALRRLCDDLLDEPGVAEAAALARTATAGCTPYGRPLYAAHADLPWPEVPHLALWHAATLLREHRGDGHVAALVCEGVSGLEAAVLHVAVGDSWSRRGLQRTRGYTDEEWDAAVAGLVTRGWLTPDSQLTEAGREHRRQVEDATDRLALPAWEALGEDGAARLRALAGPLVAAVLAGGGLGRSRRP